jgi:hypothetical protein
MTITQYVKEITPTYEWVNRHRRLTGYTAQLIDTDGTIIYSRDHSTHNAAEIALDQIVYDLLSDQPPVTDEPAQPDLATDLYNVVCLILSGAATTTAISELRRVQQRYEKKRSK